MNLETVSYPMFVNYSVAVVAVLMSSVKLSFVKQKYDISSLKEKG
jgi:hypothetical protein